MDLYPNWARIVHDRLPVVGEEGVLRELFDISCRAAKRYSRDFLERRIRTSIINGACVAVDAKGKIIREKKRLSQQM